MFRPKSLDERIAEVLRVRRIANHHSSGDWDFKNTSWELNSTIYTSSPSSLKFKANLNHCLVKTTTVPIGNVKEGRIITQWYCAYAYNVFPKTEIVFRYQDDDNYYMFQIWGDNYAARVHYKIYRRKAGVNTILRTSSTLWAGTGVWRKFRITWWNDYVGVVIRVEYWSGTEWVKLLADAYDSENNWKDVGGRIGLGDFGIGIDASYFYFDDTYIYGIS